MSFAVSGPAAVRGRCTSHDRAASISYGDSKCRRRRPEPEPEPDPVAERGRRGRPSSPASRRWRRRRLRRSAGVSSAKPSPCIGDSAFLRGNKTSLRLLDGVEVDSHTGARVVCTTRYRGNAQARRGQMCARGVSK